MKDETLIRGLAELNFSDPDKRSASLLKYIEEIETFNPAYGLVKVTNRRELIVKHILDSLTPLCASAPLRELFLLRADPPMQIADVGSGAGLPGIPLAICLPSVNFTLIERMGRRAGFLRNCTAVLGLKNVSIEETEMEKAAPHKFDLAVFRAFRPLDAAMLKNLFHILKPGGYLVAWKGRREKAEEEMINAEKTFAGISWEIIPVTVPFLEEERCIVVIMNPRIEETE